MRDTVIKTDGVTKVFHPGRPDEIRVVSDVSLEIPRGEIAVLKGPSGSGKTSLLSLIGCMSRPTQGKILVNGKDVAKLPERFLAAIRRQTFGFVFQHFNLIKGLTVLENVMLPLYPTEIGFSVIRQRAAGLLEKLGLAGKGGVRVQNLSGGEMQRIAIARALINDPEILLADEPTAHLDTGLSTDLLDIFVALRQEGKTVVIASHDPLICQSGFAERVVAMRDGMVRDILLRKQAEGC